MEKNKKIYIIERNAKYLDECLVFFFEKIYKEEIVMQELEKIMQETEREACKIEKAQNRKKAT